METLPKANLFIPIMSEWRWKIEAFHNHDGAACLHLSRLIETTNHLTKITKYHFVDDGCEKCYDNDTLHSLPRLVDRYIGA